MNPTIVNLNIERFDERAGVWDENSNRSALARSIVKMAAAEIASFAAPRMMDYGCGTGMCSLPLAHRASSLLAVDISPGMLAKVREKAETLGFGNIETLQHDLSEQPLEGREFDAIITAMALHHVRDVALVLRRFHPLLAKDGVLLIADLDKEDGSFHEDLTGVEHHGFTRDWILNALWDAGFRRVDISTVHTIAKTPAAEGGAVRSYPVFFLAARVHPEMQP